jgi:RNA polymerase sigma-70 factor (ECF subfamily)
MVQHSTKRSFLAGMRTNAIASSDDDSTAGPGDGIARLVERIQAGDRAAEAELVTRFSHGLLLMLRRLTGNPALADDLHQETLSLVLEKIRRGQVREPASLAGFIRSTARNLFIADRRKEARYSPMPEDAEGTLPAVSSSAAAPLDRALAEEEARQVQRVLSELRFDRDRQLLIRFYLRDESKEEICEDLEIEPERFNMVIHRARERMREIWEKSERRSRFFSGLRKIVDRIGGDPALRGEGAGEKAKRL